MYKNTNFANGLNMMAMSVPPPCDDSISDAFKELSRIHFYLGNTPIDFMVSAVASASLEQIERGSLQLEFAAKEIQDFIRHAHVHTSSILHDDSNDKAYYFNYGLQDVLSHSLKVLNNSYNNPNEPEGKDSVPYIADLVNQVIIFKDYLKKVGIQTKEFNEELTSIQDTYAKLYELRTHYTPLADIKPLNFYKEKAEASVKRQLSDSVAFNYNDLARIYDSNMEDSWVANVHYNMEHLADLDSGKIKINQSRATELKELAVKQLTAVNQLFSSGIVNAVKVSTSAISQEINMYSRKSKITPEAMFQSRVNGLKYLKSKFKSDKDIDRDIEKLENEKNELIATFIEDKDFFSKALSFRHRELTNINQTIDSIKEQVLGIAVKPTITFTGDINNGFVVGKPNCGDKLILVHKDSFVSHPEAVYAMVLKQSKYQELLNSNSLVFTEELRNMEFDSSSNFWSYGQFLDESSDPKVQEFFLGGSFDLIDQTKSPVFTSTLKPNIKREKPSFEDLSDDIPF